MLSTTFLLVIVLFGAVASATETKKLDWKWPSDVDWLNISKSAAKTRIYACAAFAAYIFYLTRNIGYAIIAAALPIGFEENIKVVSSVILVYGYITKNSFIILLGTLLCYLFVFGGTLF